jgi:hypothetical protein
MDLDSGDDAGTEERSKTDAKHEIPDVEVVQMKEISTVKKKIKKPEAVRISAKSKKLVSKCLFDIITNAF